MQQNRTKMKRVCVAAVAALGMYTAMPGTASAKPFEIDINLGGHHHDEVVVLEYNRYCVGFRRDLYDADWRLRNAQIEQWHANDALDDAHQRETDIAVAVETNEAVVAEFASRVADSDALLLAARASVGRAADDAAAARARLHAYEKRVEGARCDLEAGQILHEAPAIADAEARIRANEALAAAAAGDARAAENRLAELQAAEAAAAGLNDVRARLADAQARLPRLQEDLVAAHEVVYAAQQRLDAAIAVVAQALHDRDEALWLLHRDEILTGRATFASCGFTIDLSVWGGHMPRDPEVVHAYFVHPVAYWVERPVEIHTRVVEVDRIVEVTRVRQIQVKHEGPRFQEVARVEAAVPVEKRRAYAEHVTIEREHLVAERTERAAAVAEHRPPRLPEHVRAEAKAAVLKNRAEGHEVEVHGKGKEVIKEKVDAKQKNPHDPKYDPKHPHDPKYDSGQPAAK